MDQPALDNLLNRLAETEYAAVADPDWVREGLFGRFVHDPRFPERRDANQLFDCRVGRGQESVFLSELERLYEGTGLPFRKVCGHDRATYELIRPTLEARGWTIHRCAMMTCERPSQRPAAPDVRIGVVDDPAHSAELAAVHREAGRADGGLAYQLAQTERLGGETLLAWLDGRPAGTSGWFVVDGVARFRRVGTCPWAGRRGVASALIQHARDHAVVQAQDHLVILCGEDGPHRLYRELGFVERGVLWEMVRLPPP